MTKDYTKLLADTYLTNEGYEIKIIECVTKKHIKVLFPNGVIIENKTYGEVLSESIRNPYHLSVYGIGFRGVGDYKGVKGSVDVIYYKKWMSIFERCYSEKSRKKYPTYINCNVGKEWHNFQNFAKWYEENYKPYMKDWELDKDILFKGNKVYSPETCCFVPREINLLFGKNSINRGDLPIGVTKFGNGFKAHMKIDGNPTFIKYCKTIEETFQAYKVAKEEHIKKVAERWKHQITSEVYDAMINYKVEITD